MLSCLSKQIHALQLFRDMENLKGFRNLGLSAVASDMASLPTYEQSHFDPILTIF